MPIMNKVLPGHQYIANFLDQPFVLGSIFRMDDEQSIHALDLTDRYPKLKLAALTSKGSRGTLTFASARDVTIGFGAAATTPSGQSEVRLKFKRARSIAGALNKASVASLRYDPLLERLQSLWTDRGFVKHRREYFFVFEIVTAASGTLIYSEESNNEVVLEHTLGEKVTKLADLGTGRFEYVSNSKRTLEIIRTASHKPLFKAFRFRANWEPEILG